MTTSAVTDAVAQTPPEGELTMRLLVSCPDRPGIVAAVSRFLFEAGANIVQSEQYSTDPTGGTFFLRSEFSLPGQRREGLAEHFGLAVADRFGMTWRLWDSSQRKRVAVLVSRYDHCLLDLLYRYQRGELDAEIVLVASNHPDLREVVEAAGVPYHHVPVERGHKPEAEAQLLDVLAGRCDLVVLARYMQIMSGDLLDQVGVPVINIHHSFLPGREILTLDESEVIRQANEAFRKVEAGMVVPDLSKMAS